MTYRVPCHDAERTGTYFPFRLRVFFICVCWAASQGDSHMTVFSPQTSWVWHHRTGSTYAPVEVEGKGSSGSATLVLPLKRQASPHLTEPAWTPTLNTGRLLGTSFTVYPSYIWGPIFGSGTRWAPAPLQLVADGEGGR